MTPICIGFSQAPFQRLDITFGPAVIARSGKENGTRMRRTFASPALRPSLPAMITMVSPIRKKNGPYLEANVLDPYGFDGWIGPEPHGADPLRTGSSAPKGQQGRDPAISQHVRDLLGQLHANSDNTPWFMAASFTNPHDIALWGLFPNLGVYRRAREDEPPFQILSRLFPVRNRR